MWILESSKKDFTYLILPAFLIMALSFLFPLQDNFIHIALLLFIFHIVDSGHVYLTIFRTYANPDELKSSKMYFYVPLLIFISFFVWLITNSPYIWHFVVYATFYHNVRQFYGVTRWYQKKIKNYSPWPGRFLYTLCFLPVLIYHFRSGIPIGIFSSEDIFYHPSKSFLQIGLVGYSFVLLSWLSYESYGFIKKKSSLGLFLSLLTPIAAYAYGLLYGQNYLQILGPIVIAHGIGYAALIAFSIQKTHPKKYSSFKRTMLLILGVAVIFGIIEAYTEDFLEPLLQGLTAKTNNHWLFSTVAALYLTPLFSHYIFDSFIWKSKHREAHLIYT